jgi:hypothetical protein
MRIAAGQSPMCMLRTHELSFFELVKFCQWTYVISFHIVPFLAQLGLALAAPLHVMVLLSLLLASIAVNGRQSLPSAAPFVFRVGMILWFFPLPVSWMLMPIWLWAQLSTSFLQYIVLAISMRLSIMIFGKWRSVLSPYVDQVESFLIRGFRHISALAVVVRRHLQTKKAICVWLVLLHLPMILFPCVFLYILWYPCLASLIIVSVASSFPEEHLRVLRDISFRVAPATPRERGQSEQFLRDEEEKTKMYRHCPRCRAPIARTEGCLNMICGADGDNAATYRGAGCLHRFNWNDAEAYEI